MIRTVLLLGMLLLAACAQEGKEKDTSLGQHVDNPPPGQDLFPEKVKPEHARHFSVTYHGHYKVVRTDATFFPDGATEDGTRREDVLVLVQRGAEVPALTGALQGAQIIPIPLETVAVNVQHAESFLRELGLEGRINAIGGLYSFDDTMRNKALKGEIGQVGYSWHSPPNIEVLVERQPDAFLMTMASLDHTESLEKCRQLGIPTAAVFDWAEQDYLARAEWLKFFALFFNAEARANQVFADISARIDTLKALAAATERESALWGYYMGKSRWLVQLQSFPAQYLRDANLDNVLLDNTEWDADGKQVLTTEQLMLRGKEAEHWVIGDIHALPLPQEEIMSSFKAWNSGQLYHNVKRVDPKTNTSDWYATAVVRPDMVLADLIKLVHPQLLPDHQPVFMGPYDKFQQGISLNE